MSADRVDSVNDLIERLAQLDGREVRVAGILRVEFEGDSLLHHPASERWPKFELGLAWAYDFTALRTPRDELAYEFGGRYVEVTALVDQTPTWCHAGRLRIRRIVDLGVGDSTPWPYRERPPLPWRERLRAARARRRRGISWDHELRRRIGRAWERRPGLASLRSFVARRRIWARVRWLGWKQRLGRTAWWPRRRGRDA